MGLLNHRLEPSQETVFQGVARLSLLNDSDQLMERMVCLLPDWDVSDHDPFHSLAREDLYGTQAYNITPTCDVVGVGEEDFTGTQRAKSGLSYPLITDPNSHPRRLPRHPYPLEILPEDALQEDLRPQENLCYDGRDSWSLDVPLRHQSTVYLSLIHI